MRNSIKNIRFKLFLLLIFCRQTHASMPGLVEKLPQMCASALAESTLLDPDALTHLIIDRDSSGIPIELWEEIILPYVGIDGGLQTLCKSEHIPFTELKDHTDYIRSAQFNHDGTPNVIIRLNGTRIWTAAMSNHLHIFTKSRIISAQFNHDATQVVTANWDRTARAWHLPNTKPSLNQMILLWALEQHKQKNNINQKLILRTLSKQHKIPQATLHTILATFSRHDQKNIEKTFNVDVRKERLCAIQ